MNDIDLKAKPQTKHTPGPWTDDSMEFTAGLRCIVNLPDGRSIDVADPRDYKTSLVDRQNARLIAAAPELLEALELMVAVANWDHRLQSEEEHDAMIVKAEAAIRKAKGDL